MPKNRMSFTPKFAAAILISSAALICPAATGLAPAADVDMLRADPARRIADNVSVSRLRIPLQKSRTFRVMTSFQNVLVGSPDIVDVVPLNNRELYVLAKKLGTTNISVLDRDKRLVGLIDVEVSLDAGDIAAKVHTVIGSHGIRVSSQGNKIFLSGVAPDVPTVDRAVGIATELAPEGGGVVNTVRVASPQQVMLRVRILEASRNAGRELGFRWELLGRSIQGRVGPLGPPSILNHRVEDQANPGTALAIATSAITGNPQVGHIVANLINTGNLNVDLFINALETRGLVRRLAEPNLMALSGDTAEFLAGGEIPVPTPAPVGQAPGVTFKPFGVRLAFTPTVLGSGLINLRLEPEVSDIDPNISVNTGAGVIPGLSTRRARTVIELRDGQSFAIAGLLQAISQRDIEQFPWLGSIPVVGALLRSTAFQQRETELVVIVTPSLVSPAKPTATIASPLDTTIPANDLDLFLLGKLERKKSRPAAVQQYIPVAGAVSGPYGHILTSPVNISDAAPTAQPVAVSVPSVAVVAKD